MGTLVETVLPVTEDRFEQAAQAAANAVFEEFERLSAMLNRFDERSDLAHLNALAASGPTRVADELAELLNLALQFGEDSGGCFSVTLGPLAELWRDASERRRLPIPEAVGKARRLSDPRLIRREGRDFFFTRPGLAFDLGGFAKGVAVDRALNILDEHGIAHACVNAGTSSIGVLGASDGDRQPWRFGVRHPRHMDATVGIVVLGGESGPRSLATSGTDQQAFEIAGREYSHILDPRTGYPLERPAAATVTCHSAALAEVCVKMLLLEGCEAGIEAGDANGWEVEGLALHHDSATDLVRAIRTEDFPFIPDSNLFIP